MSYKKAEIAEFAKCCARGQNQILNGIMIAEQIAYSDIGREFSEPMDENLLLEIAKKYAKFAKDECGFDVDTGETQTFQSIIGKIVECCEEHDWFNE